MEMTERGDVIPMAIGLPAPELLPLELYRELMREALVLARAGKRAPDADLDAVAALLARSRPKP